MGSLYRNYTDRNLIEKGKTFRSKQIHKSKTKTKFKSNKSKESTKEEEKNE